MTSADQRGGPDPVDVVEDPLRAHRPGGLRRELDDERRRTGDGVVPELGGVARAARGAARHREHRVADLAGICAEHAGVGHTVLDGAVDDRSDGVVPDRHPRLDGRDEVGRGSRLGLAERRGPGAVLRDEHAVDRRPVGRPVAVEVDAGRVALAADEVAVRVDRRDDVHVVAGRDGSGVADVLGDLDPRLLVAVDRADHEDDLAPRGAEAVGGDRSTLQARADLVLGDHPRRRRRSGRFRLAGRVALRHQQGQGQQAPSGQAATASARRLSRSDDGAQRVVSRGSSPPTGECT